MREKLVREGLGNGFQDGGDEPTGAGAGAGAGNTPPEQQLRLAVDATGAAWRAAGEPRKGCGQRGTDMF